MALLGSSRARAGAVAVVAVSLLFTACSSDDSSEDLPTIERPVAASSPIPAAAPTGLVIALSENIDSITFDASSGLLAAVAGATVAVVDPAKPDVPPRNIDLPKPARAVAAVAANTVVAVGDDLVSRIDLPSGTRTDLALDVDALSVTGLPDGRFAVGTADGHTLVVGADGAVATDIDGLASVDALATVDGEVVAVDRRQTSVTLLDTEAGDLDLSLRAGEGATNVATDEFGRVLVADTTGDELLVHTSDPFLLRQRFPVGAAPYAIGYDDGTDLVWLTLPASNEAVGFDLATGIPVEKARIPTVRQPNSIAVNAAAGQLYVASGSGDGIQVVDVRNAGGR